MNLRYTKVIELGVDLEYIYKIFGGNENLYLSLCYKFLQDNSYTNFHKALLLQNYREANLHLHTLKGVAANLGFYKLAEISSLLLQDIREHNDNIKVERCHDLQSEYNRIINIIKSP